MNLQHKYAMAVKHKQALCSSIFRRQFGVRHHYHLASSYPNTPSGVAAAPITSKEEGMQALAALTLQLVRDHSVPQSELLKAIRTTLTDASKGMPRTPVLYCASYSSFDLSDYFKEYARQRGHVGEVKDANYYKVAARGALGRLIPDFGEHVMQQYPYLADLVLTYRHSNAWEALSLVKKVAGERKELATIGEALVSLDEHIAREERCGTSTSSQRAKSGKGKHAPDKHLLYSTHRWWHNYDVDDLKAFRASPVVGAVKSEHMKAIEEITSSAAWQSLPADVVDAITTHAGEAGGKGDHSYTAFMDAVVKVGPERPSIWQQQCMFCQETLPFLARAKKLDFPPAVYAYFAGQQRSDAGGDNDGGFQVDLQAVEVVNEEPGRNSSLKVVMGLLAAAPSCTQLAIAHVPPLVECTIMHHSPHAYDGEEESMVVM